MAIPRSRHSLSSARSSSIRSTTASSHTTKLHDATTSTQHALSTTLISTSNPLYTTYPDATPVSRQRRAASRASRPGTARPRTGVSTLGVQNQEVICAVSESRGIAPTVGLAFVNLDTGEAVLSQFSDSPTYVKTSHKLAVFNPSKILVVSTSASPKSKLFSVIEEQAEDVEETLGLLDRRYWSESVGLEYITQLAFTEDLESVKTAINGNYYAVCCFAAALKYVELAMQIKLPSRSLNIKYEPSEGSMMIDLATIRALELVQNLQDSKSKDCLFGLLDATLTPMGARLLRSNILQPLTNPDTLQKRYDAVEELSTKEETFFAVRQALKPMQDIDRILTQLILVPNQPTLAVTEHSINSIMMLKQFVFQVKPIFEGLTGTRCEILREIQRICAPESTEFVSSLIDSKINEDTAHARQPLDLRNQRTYAVKSGVNGLLDVARQTYKESMTDTLQHIADLCEEHQLPLQTKFDNTRHFYLRLRAEELEDRELPAIFVNVYRKKDMIECQTLDLVKYNQKIGDAHNEVLISSDKSITELLIDVREQVSGLFKICEGIGMLDMLASFAHSVASHDYTRPVLSDTLAIRAGRHPIREKIHHTKFVANDVYATQQTRFQIITGCNMSGKSTYIRTVALLTVMAQIGSFVPAQYAAFPIIRQLFARVSLDETIEANVSTFAAEMRETAFILQNIDRSSMAVVDELGRGTSTRDGLAIALAIAEALVESRALIWFATHFRDLANILAERSGVMNLYLQTKLSRSEDHSGDSMEMLYRISSGTVADDHYGLQISKLVPFPPGLLEHAELVSRELERQMRRRKEQSIGIVHARRRKLMLNLREHLLQAKQANMSDANLKQWLGELQREFVVRMDALDQEASHMKEDEDEDMMSEALGGSGADVHPVGTDMELSSDTEPGEGN